MFSLDVIPCKSSFDLLLHAVDAREPAFHALSEAIEHVFIVSERTEMTPLSVGHRFPAQTAHECKFLQDPSPLIMH